MGIELFLSDTGKIVQPIPDVCKPKVNAFLETLQGMPKEAVLLMIQIIDPADRIWSSDLVVVAVESDELYFSARLEFVDNKLHSYRVIW